MNPKYLYKNDPTTGPMPIPILVNASMNPIYLSLCSGSSIAIRLIHGIVHNVLAKPCKALKVMATPIIFVFDFIKVTKPKKPKKILIMNIPR